MWLLTDLNCSLVLRIPCLSIPLSFPWFWCLPLLAILDFRDRKQEFCVWMLHWMWDVLWLGFRLWSSGAAPLHLRGSTPSGTLTRWHGGTGTLPLMARGWAWVWCFLLLIQIFNIVVASAVQGLPRCDPEWERAGKYVTGNIIHLFSALPFAKASENRLRLMVCIWTSAKWDSRILYLVVSVQQL